MAVPNSKSTLKEYCLRALGKPVIEINVDDDQVDDRIDEALQYFHQYHYEGSIKMYLKHKITDSKITTMKSDESFTESAAGNHAYTDEQFKQQQKEVKRQEAKRKVFSPQEPSAAHHSLITLINTLPCAFI